MSAVQVVFESEEEVGGYLSGSYASQTPVKNRLAGNKCVAEGCPNILSRSQMTISLNAFGKPVCMVHQKDSSVVDEGGVAVANAMREQRRQDASVVMSAEEIAQLRQSFLDDGFTEEQLDGAIVEDEEDEIEEYSTRDEKPLKPRFVIMLPDVPSTPPGTAKFLLATFLSRERQDDEVGDLCEVFERRCQEYGPRRARFWFWVQTIRSLFPHLGESFAEWLRKLLADVASDSIKRIGS